MQLSIVVKAAAVIALIAAIATSFTWHDQNVPSAPPPVPVDMSRMSLARAIVHCRALWAQQAELAPLAIAWQPQQLDWYVLAWPDTASMVRITCNGQGMGGGERFVRAPAGSLTQKEMQTRNLFDYYTQLPDTGVAALEAVHDPQAPASAAPIERRWAADGRLLTAQSSRAQFPLLFARPPKLDPSEYPALVQLKPHRWLEQPDAVFAVLERHLPAGVRVAEVSFNNDSINVTIHGSFSVSQGLPNLPFGDVRYDAYGVPNFDTFYPSATSTGGCTPGRSLADIKALFAERTNAKHRELIAFTFSCTSPRAPTGRWHGNIPSRSKGQR